jgi:hypothetical protein
VLFGLGVVIGALGIWFHSGGHIVHALGQVANAWLAPPGSDAGVEIGSRPPVLAPAAFIGMGLVGIVACRRR